MLSRWVGNLTGVWNWVVRRSELEVENRIYHWLKHFQTNSPSIKAVNHPEGAWT